MRKMKQKKKKQNRTGKICFLRGSRADLDHVRTDCTFTWGE